MTDAGRVTTSLDDHGAFTRHGETFEVTTTVFDAVVEVRRRPGEPSPTIVVTVRVPTIDAVVAGETVAPVVQDGWFETFERRLEDIHGATRVDHVSVSVEPDPTAEEVVVEAVLPTDRPDIAVDDAKAVVDYVEGTFVEGIIPGYTYREPASRLLERARSAGER